MFLIVIYLILEIKYIENHLPKKVAAEVGNLNPKAIQNSGKNLCTIYYITHDKYA